MAGRGPEVTRARRRRSRLSRWGLLALIAMALIAAIAYQRPTRLDGQVASKDPSALDAFSSKLSGIFITAEGEVARILPDDLKPPRHQRFILSTDEGLSLLVAHNIDMAPRAEIELGARLRIRGQYKWNKQGGIIHKTYPAPRGKGEGGWILLIR